MCVFLPADRIDDWKLDPAGHMAEICAHIKVTKGCGLYCCGGVHTRETLALCIDEILEGVNENLP